MQRGALAIILRNRKILLGRRLKEDNFYGQWCTFGGLLEYYESPKQALIRELREELELKL